MSLDPEAEYRRIHEKYAPGRLRDLLIVAAAAAAVFVVSLFWHVDWWVFAGTVAAFIGWEVAKLRLRRNARRFAGRAL